MTVVQELAEMKDQFASIEANLEAAQTTILEKDAAIAELSQAKAEAEAKVESMQAAHDEAIAGVRAEVENEKQAHLDTIKKLEAAEKALENPAFADAANIGSKSAIEEGGAEAEAGQVAFASKEEAEAAYRKITDPKARAEFRKEHRDILGL